MSSRDAPVSAPEFWNYRTTPWGMAFLWERVILFQALILIQEAFYQLSQCPSPENCELLNDGLKGETFLTFTKHPRPQERRDGQPDVQEPESCSHYTWSHYPREPRWAAARWVPDSSSTKVKSMIEIKGWQLFWKVQVGKYFKLCGPRVVSQIPSPPSTFSSLPPNPPPSFLA